mmetsp:Transcript_2466/g.2413  ORF Transcript_2466/g.2413 Transcript_2466/m.2413 type:complete len:119 (+) Transcript_2466:191-547(+)
MAALGLIVFCAAFCVLKESITALKMTSPSTPSFSLANVSSQGIKYKCLFLITLFIALLARSLSFVYKSLSSIRWLMVAVTEFIWNLPSFFILMSFSFFIYYLARINIQMERNNRLRPL